MDIWLDLGFLYQTQSQWNTSLNAYSRSFALADQVRNQHWSSIINYRRGNIFERQGHTDDALVAYQQSDRRHRVAAQQIEGEEIKIGLLGTTQQVLRVDGPALPQPGSDRHGLRVCRACALAGLPGCAG